MKKRQKITEEQALNVEIYNLLRSDVRRKYKKITDLVITDIYNQIKSDDDGIDQRERALLNTALISAMSIYHFDKENKRTLWWTIGLWASGVVTTLLAAKYIVPVSDIISKYVIGM